MARGNSSSAAPDMDDDGSQPELELTLVSSSRVRKLQESEQCWKEEDALMERLQISREQRPYMNLDEFVTSLARKNCFDDQDRIDDRDENCSVQQTSTISDAEGSEEFPRLFGGAEGADDEDLQGDIAAVETSLRLATSSSFHAKSIHHSKPAQRRTATLVSPATPN